MLSYPETRTMTLHLELLRMCSLGGCWHWNPLVHCKTNRCRNWSPNLEDWRSLEWKAASPSWPLGSADEIDSCRQLQGREREMKEKKFKARKWLKLHSRTAAFSALFQVSSDEVVPLLLLGLIGLLYYSTCFATQVSACLLWRTLDRK